MSRRHRQGGRQHRREGRLIVGDREVQDGVPAAGRYTLRGPGEGGQRERDGQQSQHQLDAGQQAEGRQLHREGDGDGEVGEEEGGDIQFVQQQRGKCPGVVGFC